MVVDDGSTDNSREVIAGYGSAIRTIFQTNAGHATACRNGWRALGTPVVMFLDSDDMLAPGAASAVARTWRPGISKVQFQLEVTNERGEPSGVIFPKFPPNYDNADKRAELLRNLGHLAPPTTGNAYSATVLETLASFDELPAYIDSALNLLAPFVGDVATLNERHGFYRAHGTNVWMMRDFNLDTIERRMTIEVDQQRLLIRICEHFGVPFDADLALRNMPSHQENRLAMAKFGRGRPTAEPLWRVVIDNVRAQAGTAFTPRHRIMLMAWTASVALLPAGAARTVFMQRVSPVHRSPFLERLIGLLSGRWRADANSGNSRLSSSRPTLPAEH
jgi:hypothetical protein